VSFDVPADAYARFMGRYSRPLATAFADLVGVSPGQRVLDVGCGPGALTEELVGRVGAENVSAIDPASAFVAAVSRQLPGVSVALGGAEHLPYPDGGFDAVLAQLVVHFMTDPVAGLAEMARVVRPGGVVAANVWDHTDDRGPLSLFWSVVREIDPSATDESQLAGAFEGHLVALFEAAGMAGPVATVLSVPVVHPSFEEWWEPYTLGVGPAGDYVAALGTQEREALRARCAARLPVAPFTVEAAAWTVWWRAPAR
jgi:SAM-dependent methyltransferase